MIEEPNIPCLLQVWFASRSVWYSLVYWSDVGYMNIGLKPAGSVVCLLH